MVSKVAIAIMVMFISVLWFLIPLRVYDRILKRVQTAKPRASETGRMISQYFAVLCFLGGLSYVGKAMNSEVALGMLVILMCVLLFLIPARVYRILPWWMITAYPGPPEMRRRSMQVVAVGGIFLGVGVVIHAIWW